MAADPLDHVRRQLDDLRKRNGVQAGDEFDLILKTLEGVAESIHALGQDASSLIAEGQRSVGAIVSATMTGQAIWRMYVLPAAVSALLSVLVMGWSTASAYRACGTQGEADRVALQARAAQLAHQYDDYRQLLERHLQTQQASLDADRARIEGELPGLLLQKAEQLTGAARGLVQLEASNPGFIDFIARSGIAAKHIADANGGALCPRTGYVGNILTCEYTKQ